MTAPTLIELDGELHAAPDMLPRDLTDDDQDIDFIQPEPEPKPSCGNCRNSPYATYYPKCGLCSGPNSTLTRYEPL